MLNAQNLQLTFNPGTPIETRALRGMSLSIPEGQFVTVIGSNGAGKSTFLNAVSGDQEVDEGRSSLMTKTLPSSPFGSEPNWWLGFSRPHGGHM